MARGFWSGSIRFGLVNIPVSLRPASEGVDLDFDLVDARDFAPVGYRKFNKTTGRDVPRDKIVKTFKVDEGEAVVVTDEDFARARPEDAHAFVIDTFVDLAEIRPPFFDTPYLLEPQGKDAHAYVLLRKTLEKSGKAAVAKGMLRTRERLAAIFAEGEFLILNTLRYLHELREREPSPLQEKPTKLAPAELKMAEQLVEQMTGAWDPSGYHDEYRDQLLSYIRKKAQAGEARKIYSLEEAPAPAATPRADIMSLLQASVGEREAAPEDRMKHEALDPYRDKRDFSASPEPRGGAVKRRAAGLHYFIQKHAARALHFDFRLELDGVLKSWAVPKGPSLSPGDKRLAVEVEDHPLEYGRFEGSIPKGHYGAGTVEVWDEGLWTPEGDPHDGLKKGRLTFRLDGKRLKGVWSLVRMRPEDRSRKNNWLLIRSRKARVSAVEETPPRAARTAFLKPQLATLVASAPRGEEWIHELKFDGYRLIACVDGRKVTLFTRSGLDWTDRFGGVAKALAGLRLKDTVLDGELVALDENGISSFAALQKSLSEGRSEALVYYVFDLLRSKGADLRERGLLDRKEQLAGILKKKTEGLLRYTDHVRGSGDSVQQEACRLGLEGIVSKKADSPYTEGRGPDWVKVKCVKEQEFVIGGYTDPQGSRQGLGALLLGVHQGGALVYAGRVGTGFDVALLRDLRTRLEKLGRDQSPYQDGPAGEERRGVHWVEPSLVAQVRFTGWTDDHRLRHPVFQGLREDKPAREVKREAPQPPSAESATPAAAGVVISHPDRVVYPEQKLTKLDVARYYERAADRLLPYIADRPLSLLRCPDGREGPCFYQKNWVKSGDAVKTLRIAGKSGSANAPVIADARGLLRLIQHGALELHPWGSRTPAIENPDVCVFDLDPAPDVPWPDLAAAARALRERLQSKGLESFLKTTGGKGLHVVLPLQGRTTWEELKNFAKSMAVQMTRDHPELYVATMSKQARRGRIFIDWLRNGRGATAVAPYSTRARAHAPIAAPLTWEELGGIDRADAFTISTIAARLEKEDPWKGYFQVRQRLPKPPG